MTRRLWSISALATELNKDRRTVAKALRDVPPDGRTSGGHNGWRLESALRALNVPTGEREGLPLSPGFKVIHRASNPFDQGFLIAALLSVYLSGALAAEAAALAGASMRVAYALHGQMVADAGLAMCEACREFGIEPFPADPNPAMFSLDAILEPDWEALAREAGEEVDLEVWKAWKGSRRHRR